MRTLLSYILEVKGVSQQIQIMADYIYQQIKELVDQDSDKGYDNLLDEYIDIYDENINIYPIEINFSDIKGFDPKKYDLLTYRKMGPDYEDYDCDMIVSICKYTTCLHSLKINI